MVVLPVCVCVLVVAACVGEMSGARARPGVLQWGRCTVFVHASAFVRARAGVGVYAKGVSVSMHVCARACVRGYPRHRGRPSKYASPSCRLGRAREGRGER